MRRRGIRTLEGFAGPGGLSEAARIVGLGGGLGVELNANACATAEAAGHRRLQVDIRSLDPADFPDVEVWVSAPPCQTFAGVGKQSGIGDYQVVLDGIGAVGFTPGAETEIRGLVADPRTALVLETLRFAVDLPHVRVLIAEQVQPVRSIWVEMCAELAASHRFDFCHVITVAADDLGVPTRRTRAFFIATRGDDPDFSDLPMRAHWSCGRFGPGPVEHGPNRVGGFPRISMAQALDWPRGLRINTRGERKTAGGNEFSADGPAQSLTGNGARTWYRTDLGSVAGRITASQAGLLQGFPRDYPWQGSRTSQFQQVADTVSPIVGAAVVGAATGVPWRDAVDARLLHLYGAQAASVPAAAEQLDLFTGAAA